MISRHLQRLTAIGLLLGTGLAQAHYLWIEPAQGGSALYYGEAEALLRESSPGRLDLVQGASAVFTRVVGTQAQPAALRRLPAYLAIATPADATGVLVREESLEVRDLTANGLGLAKIHYYARHGQPAAAAPALPLDVQGTEPGALTVLYQGKPLAHAKLEVIAPNAWVQEHQTDKHGRVRINTPWRGLYVLHMLHQDPTPGEFAGKRYDRLRVHFTYSFVHPHGPDAGPALAPQRGKD